MDCPNTSEQLCNEPPDQAFIQQTSLLIDEPLLEGAGGGMVRVREEQRAVMV
jgi:hypothetical protein